MLRLDNPWSQSGALVGLRAEIVFSDPDGLPLGDVAFGVVQGVSEQGLHIQEVNGVLDGTPFPAPVALALGDTWGVFEAVAAIAQKGEPAGSLLVRPLSSEPLYARQRRGAERVQHRVPVRLTPKMLNGTAFAGVGDRWIPATMIDISVGGLQIEVDSALPSGLILISRFQLEGIDCEVDVQVVRSTPGDAPIRVGVVFVDLPVVDRSVVHAFVSKYSRTHRRSDPKSRTIGGSDADHPG